VIYNADSGLVLMVVTDPVVSPGFLMPIILNLPPLLLLFLFLPVTQYCPVEPFSAIQAPEKVVRKIKILDLNYRDPTSAF